MIGGEMKRKRKEKLSGIRYAGGKSKRGQWDGGRVNWDIGIRQY